MSLDASAVGLLRALAGAGVEFLVVGGAAAVLQGAPIATQDLDIVHRRTPENVDRLFGLLISLDAHYRYDLQNRKLPPQRAPLFGHGHINLSTRLGPLDVLCELGLGEGYDELVGDCEPIDFDGATLLVLGLRRLIAVKAAAGRAKDRQALPILLATLEDRERSGEGDDDPG